MTGRPHPELRGRLRASGAISTEVVIGSRSRRWAITAALLGLVALVAAASAVIGLPFALGMALTLVATLIGGLWLVLATAPARDRPIAGAFLLTGRRELSRFRKATGRRLPREPAGACAAGSIACRRRPTPGRFERPTS